jgi:hypothetical protein
MTLNFLFCMDFSIYFNDKSQIMAIKVSDVELKFFAASYEEPERSGVQRS